MDLNSLVRIASYAVFQSMGFKVHFSKQLLYKSELFDYRYYSHYLSNPRNTVYLKELHQAEGLISVNDAGIGQATTKFWMKN